MRSVLLVNQSTIVTPAGLAAALAALQTQVSRDFAPLWGIDAKLSSVAVPATTPHNPGVEAIYLLDNSDQAGALGYHLENAGVPTGYVFTKDSVADVGEWTSCLSHELLEQLADPEANQVAIAPLSSAFGADRGKLAAIAYETCDAVENDTYHVGTVPVSNFVTPAWFLPGEAVRTRFDLLHRLTSALTLTSGGYVSYTLDLTDWKDATARRAIAKSTHSRYRRRRLRTLRQRLQASGQILPTAPIDA